MTFEDALMSLYRFCASKYGWSLKDMDESDYETLILFWSYEKEHPTTKNINGKTYQLAAHGPAWL